MTKKDNQTLIRESIIRDMSEGVMTIGLDGVITFVNPMAASILGKATEELMENKFARCFFEYDENDSFNQLIIDAIYDENNSQRGVVNYFDGERIKNLHLTTSFLHNEGNRVGIVVVINDLSELFHTRNAFSRFLSDDIVNQLLESPDGLSLGGKKQNLTVMMSDLRGFTSLSEKMDAEELLLMLNYYLGEMTKIIQARKGTIIEFIGDGIMAIFGAPIFFEDHATRAVVAAIEMQAKMEEVNQWNMEHGFPELQMGIGINTGDVVVGNIGSEQRTKYGVVGESINLAGRIESYTVGGQALVSPYTLEQVDVELQIDGSLNVHPKGLTEPIDLYHVVGVGAPYHVQHKRIRLATTTLEEPREIIFCLIDGKHTSEELIYGKIVEESKEGAILTTKYDLHVFQNIQINEKIKQYAKILEKVEAGYYIQYTSN